jgi:phage FluMu gp28-like protein
MEIQLPIQNFQKQELIFQSQSRYTIVSKGRRFGLTKGAANNFIESAYKGKFKKGLWVDTVNANIDKYIERYFIPHLNKLPKHIWDWRKQAKMLVMGNAFIDFRSADTPETMEGFGYDKAFLNEAGIILKNEYLWNNAIMPMFWDYPNVKVVIGGTPKGKGKFWELYQRGQDTNQTTYKSFHFTSFDSPFKHIHNAIQEDIASMPEKVIKQEIYAEFLEDTGVVFRNFMDVMDAKPNKPQSGHRYVMGVDLAKVEDFTVLSVYDAESNKQVYQARFNKIDWGMQKARIAETAKHYNKATVVIDATGLGDPIVDDLARHEIPVDPIKFTNDIKRQLIEKLANWIELKRIHMINIPETVTELSNFTYDISELSDKVRYGAPVGFHDDIVIANALAVWRLITKTKEVVEKPKTLIRHSYETKLREQIQDQVFDPTPEQWSEWGAEA